MSDLSQRPIIFAHNLAEESEAVPVSHFYIDETNRIPVSDLYSKRNKLIQVTRLRKVASLAGVAIVLTVGYLFWRRRSN